MSTESKRIPSIHISLPALQEAMRTLFKDMSFIEGEEWDKAGEHLFKILRKKNLDHRSVVITNQRTERKIEQVLKAGRSETDQVCNIISMYRRNRKKTKLYSTKKITPEHKDYTKAKELTKIILNYAQMFDLEFKEAIIKYLDITVPKITSGLNFVHKLVNMEELVIQQEEMAQELLKDEDPVETRSIRDLYNKRVSERTGIITKAEEVSDMIHFMEVRRITDDLDIPTEIYLEAQFHGLSWTDSYPTPKQLLGDKAIERLQKYLYEKKIKVKTAIKDDKQKAKDKLKNLLNDKNRDR